MVQCQWFGGPLVGSFPRNPPPPEEYFIDIFISRGLRLWGWVGYDGTASIFHSSPTSDLLHPLCFGTVRNSQQWGLKRLRGSDMKKTNPVGGLCHFPESNRGPTYGGRMLSAQGSHWLAATDLTKRSSSRAVRTSSFSMAPGDRRTSANKNRKKNVANSLVAGGRRQTV